MANTRTNTNVLFRVQVSLSNQYSYAAEIVVGGDVVVSLPMDVMDNTLAGAVSAEALIKLGTEAKQILADFSQWLQAEVGAKEFIVLPTAATMTDFVAVEKAEFKRVRQATLNDVTLACQAVISHHPEAYAYAKQKLQTIIGTQALINTLNQPHPYAEIYNLLDTHAAFTASKQAEYNVEAVKGAIIRFNQQAGTVLGLVDLNNRLRGVMRGLKMQDGMFYVSDETVDQSILPLNYFSAESDEQKMRVRQQFLLAYLMQQYVLHFTDQQQLLMIAASGREAQYSAVGFSELPMHNNAYYVAMKFGQPGKQLKEIKASLLANPLAASPAGLFNAAPDVNKTANSSQQISAQLK